MTIAVVWPSEFRPKSLLFQPDAPDRGGTVTIDGGEQIVASPGGRWSAKMTFDVYGPANNALQQNRMLFWRAMEVRMQGRAGRILIGPFDWMRPSDMAGIKPSVWTVFSDGTSLSDATQIRQSSVSAVLNVAANQMDTVVTIAIDPGFLLSAGQYIGLGGCRLHRLTSVVALGTTDAVGRPLYQVAVWPWLRSAYAPGVDVELEKPLCLMRFKTALTGALDIQAPWKSSPTIELVEAF